MNIQVHEILRRDPPLRRPPTPLKPQETLKMPLNFPKRPNATPNPTVTDLTFRGGGGVGVYINRSGGGPTVYPTPCAS